MDVIFRYAGQSYSQKNFGQKSVRKQTQPKFLNLRNFKRPKYLQHSIKLLSSSKAVSFLYGASSNPPREKKWRLYILPQCLANLTQPKRHEANLIIAMFVPVQRILSSLGLKIL